MATLVKDEGEQLDADDVTAAAPKAKKVRARKARKADPAPAPPAPAAPAAPAPGPAPARVHLVVFAKTSGIRPRDLAGFIRRMENQPPERRTLVAWRQAYEDFLKSPVTG